MNPLLQRYVLDSLNLKPNIVKTQNSLLKIGNKGHKSKVPNRTILCPVCRIQVKPYWERTYHTVRARCSTCGINWKELE